MTLQLNRITTSVRSLRAAVERSWAAHDCNCDYHAPKLYQQEACKELHHLAPCHIRDLVSDTKTDRYNSMGLAHRQTEWLDYASEVARGEECANKAPIWELRDLLKSLSAPLNAFDARESLDEKQMTHLIEVINGTIFSGKLPRAVFHWKTESTDKEANGGTVYGLYGMNWDHHSAHIWLNPLAVRGQEHNASNFRRNHRLGVLLHELLHNFIDVYACKSCPTFSHCVGPDGHGRAFLVLAARIEKVMPMILDDTFNINLGRVDMVKHHVKASGKLPSVCDLDRYRLETCLN
ncbi:hypothetical protein CC80DRAFT_498685 [Byssothecium circinans]|uniref:SprT-like domain-containing protein n=1 Tax=Byssothecium circinans TaxID=147558 RepID=A0A6A5UR08_9PLEO|nr:hypothetical protein CC80DRAFT_498685 [Byssothecium circinans]